MAERELDLRALTRISMDAALPATIATVDAQGVPNVSYLSRVLYVDDEHLALSNQFFRKTLANLEAGSGATLMLVSPRDGRHLCLELAYRGSHHDGPIFDKLTRELEAVATQTGMQEVFRLRSALVFRVEAITALPLPESAP